MNPLYNKHIHPKFSQVRYFAVQQLAKISDKDIEFVLLQLVQALRYEDLNNSFLKKYLISRCCGILHLASCFYWFLNVEADDENMKDMKEKDIQITEYYKKILNEFVNSLDENVKKGIENQLELRSKLIGVAMEISKAKNKEQKAAKLPQIIKAGGSNDLSKLNPPLNLPLDPNVKVSSAIFNKGIVFVSAKYPIKYSFRVASETQENISKENPGVYDIMFKYGDDLRQDQLILQIIAYMDNLLRKINIDMEFTTYKVLATSKSDGFVEFVSGCKTITDILEGHNDTITPYFEKLSTNSGIPYEQIMESYINSCAGYCVVTYILGIGDRHLENILINPVGRLLHIDFGFILGKDPKPYPPPMKLSKQMVECMGKDFSKFKKKCSDTYLYLRQNARLIVNMFYLMIHCGITELSENYEQVLFKLHEKFVPDMNNEEASNSINTKLDESVSALFPKMMDVIHDWAKYWK